MKDKVVRAFEPRRLEEKSMTAKEPVVILYPVIHIYWAKAEWWLNGDCSTSAALQMNEDANGGRGKLKPLVTLSAPQRCRTLSLSTSRTRLLSERPSCSHHIPRIYILMQTNTWLLLLGWANDKRQMWPPQRIKLDKLLLGKLSNNPKKSQESKKEKKKRKKSASLHENGFARKAYKANTLASPWLQMSISCQIRLLFIHDACDCFIPLHENDLKWTWAHSGAHLTRSGRGNTSDGAGGWLHHQAVRYEMARCRSALPNLWSEPQLGSVSLWSWCDGPDAPLFL